MVGMTASAPEFVPSRPLKAAAASVDDSSTTTTTMSEDITPRDIKNEVDGGASSSSTQSTSTSGNTRPSNSNSNAPVNNRKRPLANPSMVPQAPRIPKTAAEKETSRRLYIVLSQACLETYQISSGSTGSGAARRDGRYDSGGGEARYTLLNCDDHVGWTLIYRVQAYKCVLMPFILAILSLPSQQGILSKMQREVATARPDITHQVRIRMASRWIHFGAIRLTLTMVIILFV